MRGEIDRKLPDHETIVHSIGNNVPCAGSLDWIVTYSLIWVLRIRKSVSGKLTKLKKPDVRSKSSNFRNGIRRSIRDPITWV